MTNMAAMPIYGKNLKKSSSPEPIYWWPWNLVGSIVCASTAKVIQIMTLGWPWPILHQGQIWSHRLLYGKKWKLLSFDNYCSLRSQSCFKHSAKWMSLWSWVGIKSQGHSLTLVKGHSDFKVKTCFSQKQLGDLEPEFIWKLKGKWDRKFIQMSWVITNMAALSIYGKNLKKSSPEPLDRKCWRLACLLRWAIQGLRACLLRYRVDMKCYLLDFDP